MTKVHFRISSVKGLYIPKLTSILVKAKSIQNTYQIFFDWVLLFCDMFTNKNFQIGIRNIIKNYTKSCDLFLMLNIWCV